MSKGFFEYVQSSVKSTKSGFNLLAILSAVAN